MNSLGQQNGLCTFLDVYNNCAKGSAMYNMVVPGLKKLNSGTLPDVPPEGTWEVVVSMKLPFAVELKLEYRGISFLEFLRWVYEIIYEI